MSIWTHAKGLFRHVSPAAVHVPVDWIPVDPNTSDGPFALAKPLRGIRANTAGTVTVTMASGESRELNFLAGETRWGVFVAVTDATATGLEGAV